MGGSCRVRGSEPREPLLRSRACVEAAARALWTLRRAVVGEGEGRASFQEEGTTSGPHAGVGQRDRAGEKVQRLLALAVGGHQ